MVSLTSNEQVAVDILKAQENIWCNSNAYVETKLCMLTSLFESLKLLSIITAIRLDEETDNIEETFQLTLVGVPDSTLNRIWSLDSLAALSYISASNGSNDQILFEVESRTPTKAS
ncbi:hypothetical protein M5K25_022504 [Dendrobium thyrsiflorum]|uniref:Uncharacterized protein n=1 Tax=Dendrobium thyrsiflorum TaxID=117978 RepID=A0ABD0U6B3_DENTH